MENTIELNVYNTSDENLRQIRNDIIGINCICIKNVEFIKDDFNIYSESFANILKSLPLKQDKIYNDFFLENINEIKTTFSASNKEDKPLLITSDSILGIETVGTIPIIYLDENQEFKCLLSFEISNGNINAKNSATSLVRYKRKGDKGVIKFKNLGLFSDEKIISIIKEIHYNII